MWQRQDIVLLRNAPIPPRRRAWIENNIGAGISQWKRAPTAADCDATEQVRGVRRCRFATVRGENAMSGLGGLGGLIVFVLDIWALVSIFGSNETAGKKAAWIILVLVLPVIGFIIWFFAGPRSTPA
jgi:hypothetical protein